METNDIVKKNTIVPLYGFTGPFLQAVDLGDNCFIAKSPDGLFENFLKYGESFDSTGNTKVLDINEKYRFMTTYCVNNAYEGPKSPHLGIQKNESEEIVRKVVLAIQLLKFTMTAPEFIMRTQGSNYGVVDAVKTHERSYIPELVSSNSLRPFTIHDLEKVRTLWPEIKKVYTVHKNGFNRIANALEFFRVGLGFVAWQLRFVMFVVALESIYSTSNVEVAYSLSQRLAWFLGDAVNRTDYFRKAKKIYAIRSNIIHGTTISANLKVEIDSLLIEVEDMARKTLIKILLNEELINIFSETEKLKDYLEKLTLNQIESQ